MITTICLVNIHHLMQVYVSPYVYMEKKCIFLCEENFWAYSLSNLQTHHARAVAVVIAFYLISPALIDLITASLFLSIIFLDEGGEMLLFLLLLHFYCQSPFSSPLSYLPG